MPHQKGQRERASQLAARIILGIIASGTMVSAVPCAPENVAVLRGDKWMDGATIGRTFGEVYSGTAQGCYREYCLPDRTCNTSVYWPSGGRCFLFTGDVTEAINNDSDNRKDLQVAYCRGGGQASEGEVDEPNMPEPVVRPNPTPPASTVSPVPSGRQSSAGRVAFKTLCKRLLSARLDPLVNPGAVSGHVHDVFGSSFFGATLREALDLGPRAESTCDIPSDKSMYWFPSLYVHHPVTRKLELVPTFAAIYYMTRFVDNGDVHALPLGLKMILGSPAKLTGEGFTNGDLPGDQPTWYCHEDNGQGSRLEATGSGSFPGVSSRRGRQCIMWQARMNFPSCWNGRDLDSPNHKDHMAFVEDGQCPRSHPYHVPEVKFEAVFRLQFTIDKYDKAQREGKIDRGLERSDFVLSTGDETGFSMHGDFVSGWQEDDMIGMLRTCQGADGRNAPGQRCSKVSINNVFGQNTTPTRNIPDEQVRNLDQVLLGPYTGPAPFAP